MAITNSLTGYEPNLFGLSDDCEGLASIFKGSDLTQFYNYDTDKKESANAEIDDEHIRNAVASPLFTPEREAAEANLTQTYHSYVESLLRSAQSVSACSGQPVTWPTRQTSSRELDEERSMTTLQLRKEHLLAEAKIEIQKHENKPSLAEDYIRDLKGQIESNYFSGVLLTGMKNPDGHKIVLIKK